MTFEYAMPADETTVKRTFSHDVLERDMFDVIQAGETLTTVDYELARKFWLGKIELAELVKGERGL